MFSFLLQLALEFFKYQSGQALGDKFQMTQEQIQKIVQVQVTKILMKFFGGLICTVALSYSLIGLLNLLQTYISTLMYATEIKIAFFVIVIVVAVVGLKAIFIDEKLNLIQPQAAPQPTPRVPETNIVQNVVSQFVDGLTQGLSESRKKKPSDTNHSNG